MKHVLHTMQVRQASTHHMYRMRHATGNEFVVPLAVFLYYLDMQLHVTARNMLHAAHNLPAPLGVHTQHTHATREHATDGLRDAASLVSKKCRHPLRLGVCPPKELRRRKAERILPTLFLADANARKFRSPLLA